VPATLVFAVAGPAASLTTGLVLVWFRLARHRAAAPPTDRVVALNRFCLGGRDYLRVGDRVGTLLHVAAYEETTVARRRPACRAGPPDSSLRAAAWSARTMCGLVWDTMADHRTEVDALLAAVDRPATPAWDPAGYICPVCALAVAERSGAGGLPAGG
jgi:hypothetical protein